MFKAFESDKTTYPEFISDIIDILKNKNSTLDDFPNMKPSDVLVACQFYFIDISTLFYFRSKYPSLCMFLTSDYLYCFDFPENFYNEVLFSKIFLTL